MCGGFKLGFRGLWEWFCCIGEDIDALGLSAQYVNVLRLRWKHSVLSTLSKLSESKCIRELCFNRSCRSIRHFAPTLWSEDIQYSLRNYLSRKKHDNKIYTSKKRCCSNGIIVKSHFITFSYIVGLKSKPHFLYSKLFF